MVDSKSIKKSLLGTKTTNKEQEKKRYEYLENYQT